MHFRENLILDAGLPLPRPEVEEAVALHHRRGVDVHPREHLLYRRHLDALAPGGVLPSVVGALRLAVHQLAQTQWARPVRAFVLYASRVAVGVAEHDPRDVEEVERDHGGLVQPRGECDGEPVRALGVRSGEELLLHLRGWHRRDEELAVFDGASPRRVRIRSRGGSPRRGSNPIGGGRSLRRRPGALPGCASRAGGLRGIRPPLLVVTAQPLRPGRAGRRRRGAARSRPHHRSPRGISRNNADPRGARRAHDRSRRAHAVVRTHDED
mmetsp:Transcript_881/g.3456  ORF Transcript_881/g.3456 Transcript_881/m.3456 type:complete len:268 (+) Transcript_881:1989-2792(+)